MEAYAFSRNTFLCRRIKINKHFKYLPIKILNRTQPTGNLSFNIECSSLHQQLIITFMIQFSSHPEKDPTPNKKHCVRDYKQVVNQCK